MISHTLYAMLHVTAAHGGMISRATVTYYTLKMIIHITSAHGNMVSGARVIYYTL